MRIFPVKETVRVLGLNVPDMADIPALQNEWFSMYAGHPGFLKSDQRYFNIPALLCTDLARLAVSEAKITVPDAVAQDIVDRNIKRYLQLVVEKAVALGGCYVRVYADATGVHSDIYDNSDALPVAFSDGKVTGVVFIDRKVVHRSDNTTRTYTKLEWQNYDSGTDTLTVTTKIFAKEGMPENESLGSEVPFDAVPEWAGITPEWGIKQSGGPLFVYVSSPWRIKGADNHAIGAPIYADAVDQIEMLTERENQKNWEFISGKRKMVVDESAIPVDPITHREMLKPEEQELYRKLAGSASAEATVKDLFGDFSPAIRVEAYITDIKQLLGEISKACHMDAGYLSFDETATAVTATEVKINNKESFATVCDIQNHTALDAVKDLLHAYSLLLSVTGQQSFDAVAVTDPDNLVIAWGDGIMDDPDAERSQALQEVAQGLMSKHWYLVHYRGLSDEEASQEEALLDAQAKANAPDVFANLD